MNENSRKNGFEFDGRVRYSEIGHRGTMTLPALVDYFQDCTTFHSESVGLGMERLRKEKKAWVLSYWQVIVERYPKLNEKITVGTFPTAFKGLFGNRNMYMLDAEGKRIACANPSGCSWIWRKDARKGRVQSISNHTASESRWTCPMRIGRSNRRQRAWMANRSGAAVPYRYE